MPYDLTSRAGMLSACAAAFIASAVGLCALALLSEEYHAYGELLRESEALCSAAEAGEATLNRYSKLAGGGIELPNQPECANQFYSAMLAAVSQRGLSDARVSGALVRDGGAEFLVSGNAAYECLRKFLASFASFPYIARVSKLSVEAKEGGMVSYAVAISTMPSDGGDAK